MALDQKEFDEACVKFTKKLEGNAQWKHVYLGAAYSTRLRQAIESVREACDEMEQTLIKDS